MFPIQFVIAFAWIVRQLHLFLNFSVKFIWLVDEFCFELLDFNVSDCLARFQIVKMLGIDFMYRYCFVILFSC